MRKYLLNLGRQRTRSQLRASYRLAANRHVVEQPKEYRFSNDPEYGLLDQEYRRELLKLFTQKRETPLVEVIRQAVLQRIH